MFSYATFADAIAYDPMADWPENTHRLLASASRLVRSATRTAIYDADATGMPSNVDLKAAFVEATCAQALAWVILGVDPTAGPASITGAGVATSKSIGKASISYAAPRAAAVDEAAATVTTLVPDALWCLESAGLTIGQASAW